MLLVITIYMSFVYALLCTWYFPRGSVCSLSFTLTKIYPRSPPHGVPRKRHPVSALDPGRFSTGSLSPCSLPLTISAPTPTGSSIPLRASSHHACA